MFQSDESGTSDDESEAPDKKGTETCPSEAQVGREEPQLKQREKNESADICSPKQVVTEEAADSDATAPVCESRTNAACAKMVDELVAERKPAEQSGDHTTFSQLENDLELSATESESESVTTSPARSARFSPRLPKRLSDQSNPACGDGSLSTNDNSKNNNLSESSTDSVFSPSRASPSRLIESDDCSRSGSSQTALQGQKTVDGNDGSQQRETRTRSLSEKCSRTKHFKEPLPFLPRRSRRTVKSESLSDAELQHTVEFLNRRVLRSASCPGNVNADTATENVIMTRSRSKSPRSSVSESEECVSPKAKQTQKGEKNGIDINLTSEGKTEKNGGPCMGCAVFQAESPARVTRSQSKLTRPDALKFQKGSESVQTARIEKRKKSRTDSDSEEPDMKKKNRSRYHIDPQEELSPEKKDEKKECVAADVKETNTGEYWQTEDSADVFADEVKNDQDGVKNQRIGGEPVGDMVTKPHCAEQFGAENAGRIAQSSGKVLIRQVSVHSESGDAEDTGPEQYDPDQGGKDLTHNEEGGVVREKDSQCKTIHPEDRQIDRVGSLGFIYQKGSVDKVDIAEQMLTPVVSGIAGEDGSKQPPLGTGAAHAHVPSEASMELDRILEGDDGSVRNATPSNRNYSELHHHALSLDELDEDLDLEEVLASETPGSLLPTLNSPCETVERTRSSGFCGAQEEESSDRESPLSDTPPLSPMCLAMSIPNALSPLPPTPERMLETDDLIETFGDTGLESLDTSSLSGDTLPVEHQEPGELGVKWSVGAETNGGVCGDVVGRLDAVESPVDSLETDSGVAKEMFVPNDERSTPTGSVSVRKNEISVPVEVPDLCESLTSAVSETDFKTTDSKAVSHQGNAQTRLPASIASVVRPRPKTLDREGSREMTRSIAAKDAPDEGMVPPALLRRKMPKSDVVLPTTGIQRSNEILAQSVNDNRLEKWNTPENCYDIPGAFIPLGAAKKTNVLAKQKTVPGHSEIQASTRSRSAAALNKVREKVQSNLRKTKGRSANIEDLNVVPTRQQTHSVSILRPRKSSAPTAAPSTAILGNSNDEDSCNSRDNIQEHFSTSVDKVESVPSRLDNTDYSVLGPLRPTKRVSRVKSAERLPALNTEVLLKAEPKAAVDLKATEPSMQLAEEDKAYDNLPKLKTSSEFKRRTTRFPRQPRKRPLKMAENCGPTGEPPLKQVPNNSGSEFTFSVKHYSS